MIDIVSDLTAIARAADAAVIGCSVLAPGREAEPGWTVATLPDGTRVRLDGVGSDSPAVGALRAADRSAGAVAGRAMARSTAAAVAQFLASTDPSAIAVRVIVRRLATWHNDTRERDGLPRLTEPEIVAQLLADAAAGLGAPIALPGSG